MKELFEKYSQNKNFLMFITSIIYILGLYSYFTNYSVLFCTIVTGLLLLVLLKNIASPKAVMLWLFIFYFGYGNACLRIKSTDELFLYSPSKAVITAQVVSIPNKSKEDTLRFFAKVSDINGHKINDDKLLINLKTYNPEISNPEIGYTYSFKGKISHPFISTNPSQFSYAEYLRNYQVFNVFYGENKDFHLIPTQLSLKWKMINKLNKSRLNILESHSNYLKSPNLEILGGIVFGDDAIAPPEEVKNSFVNSGLLHILAASGMNVAFIYGFWFFFLRQLRVPFNISVGSGIFVVILYALMTGLGPSVIRAAIMLVLILLGKLIDRDAHSISLLSFVALLMLLYNPAYINDVGFQLSFIVTFGLLLSTNVVMKSFEYLPNWLSGAIFVPIIAQVWVIPIQMFYFNTISVYSVFANILSMPFLSVISFGGFVSSVLALIKPISDFVCMVFDFVLNPLLNILMWISNFFANMPHSLFITTHPNIVQVMIYYTILVLGIYLLSIQFKNKRILLSILGLGFVLFVSTIQIPNNNFEVIAFDVNNADAFLLKTPNNKYCIIDTGNSGYRGSASKAKMILLKYMYDKGIKHIDSLILTHFDSDHAGGAVDLIKGLKVDKVYVNSISDKSRLAKSIYNCGKEKVCEINNSTKIIDEGDFSIELNRANPKYFGTKNVDNESSVLAIVRYGEFSMLFTGDAGVECFERMKDKLPKNITILKVGHHGARGVVNRKMIQYLNPKVSIVSVGKNHYGHPSPKTIECLACSRVYRTDTHHAIKVVSTGKEYRILTYDSDKKSFK